MMLIIILLITHVLRETVCPELSKLGYCLGPDEANCFKQSVVETEKRVQSMDSGQRWPQCKNFGWCRHPSLLTRETK